MSRTQLRRRKAAVFVLLMSFLAAIVLMLFPSEAGEAQKITDPEPSVVPYVPPAQPDREPIGPVKRTTAVVTAVPQIEFREGPYIVVDISEQRLYEMDGETLDGKPIKVSTGAIRTPTVQGEFSILRRINGWRTSRLGQLYRPLYFFKGYAIHGTSPGNYPDLGQRASHGCVRVHQQVADYLFDKYPNGTPVIVQP